MLITTDNSTWRSWLKIGRLVPLLTILAATVVGILSLLGHFQVTMAEGVIIALLTLLSIDALVERLSLLERIEDVSFKVLDAIERKETPNIENIFKERRDIKITPEMYKARKIWVSGYSLINLVRVNENFFKERLQEGCNIRFLLLKPECHSTEVLDGLTSHYDVELKNDIRTSLNRLKRVNESVKESAKGQMEVRLLTALPTFSLLMVDHDLPNGWVRVELYPSSYHVSLDIGRLHFVLTDRQGKCYKFFCNQFEELWDNKLYSEPLSLGISKLIE